MQLLHKFQPEDRHLRHARHVADLSLALFDGLQKIHRLGKDAREVLHYAALLHDVGAMIGHDGHGQHYEYIIRNRQPARPHREEVDRIATVARYHGKPRPRKRDEAVRALDRDRRRELRWLSALLRIAEALDRSHYQLVKSLKVRTGKRRVTIALTTGPGARLEAWAVARRVDLLESLLRRPVRLTTRLAPARKAKPSAGARRRRNRRDVWKSCGRGTPSVPCRKSCACRAGRSRPLARRDDDAYPLRYSEEEQRRQRPRGPARRVHDFRYGTLTALGGLRAIGGRAPSGQRRGRGAPAQRLQLMAPFLVEILDHRAQRRPARVLVSASFRW